MKVSDLVEKLELTVAGDTTGTVPNTEGQSQLNKIISGCYICDLLSWVMSHARKGDIWITILTHVNIVAVAVLTEVSCIIIPENVKVPKETIDKANEENIPILLSKNTAFEIAKEIARIGI